MNLMTLKEAVKYCEGRECEDCVVYTDNINLVTDYERINYHYPCQLNLAPEDLERIRREDEEYRRKKKIL